MRSLLSHKIIRNPPPQKADIVRVSVEVKGQGYSYFYSGSSFVEEFIDDDWNRCQTKQYLEDLFKELGFNDDVTLTAMIDLTSYVDEVTSSPSMNYSPGCALEVSMTIGQNPQMEEAIRVSFEETSKFGLKPARKLVVKSLPRKIYEKISSTGETCAICLEEFNNGGRLVTLPCGHEFDDECAIKWFETSHSCPLCRNMLPCEDLCANSIDNKTSSRI